MSTKLTAHTIRRLAGWEAHSRQYKWVTEGIFIWEDGPDKIEIPTGFLCDGSSGGPDFGHGWLFHDYLYSTHRIGDRPCTRKEADELMIRILKWERASYYALAVALLSRWNPFWLFSRAWKRSGERGPEFY